MRYKRNRRDILLFAVLIFGVMSFPGSAGAMQFNPGADTTIDCDVTINYGAGWRVSGRDHDKLANINADDGNRNFDQWRMYNNKVTLLADIDMKHKNFGLFVRPKAFYDHAYMTDNDNNSAATNNAFVGGIIKDHNDWADDVEDIHGRNWEILDLFGYSNFNLGDRNIEFRVGKQVISWGESLLISGGISSAQSYVDVAASVAVGTEVKEIFLPSESVFLQMEITNALALSGYYQWKWEKNRLFEGGSFFATSAAGDILDDLGAPILAAPGVAVYPRGKDDDASDNGQFGVALTYVLPWISDTELGLYYINYHDKMPLVNRGAPFTPYFLSYTEDIKLYGASFSSVLGLSNISGEVSYRQDYGFTPAEKNNYYQAQTSAIYATSFKPLADQISTVGEVACARTVGRADDVFAWKYIARVTFDWYQVLRDLDLKGTLAYTDQPSGSNVLGVEGAASGSIKLESIYKQVYKSGITYENRFNSIRNTSSDRDTLSLYLSYTF